MCLPHRGRHRIAAAKLCAIGPDRCVLRSFYTTPVISSCVRIPLWSKPFKLCVVLSIHVSVSNYCVLRRQSYKPSSLRVCGPVAAIMCELVHGASNFHPLFKAPYCLLSVTSNVYCRIRLTRPASQLYAIQLHGWGLTVYFYFFNYFIHWIELRYKL